MARRRKSGKKRTLSPEQLEKMRQGRENAKKHREREARLEESGMPTKLPMSHIQQELHDAATRPKTRRKTHR